MAVDVVHLPGRRRRGGAPRAAKKRVMKEERMIWTPEPSCTHSSVAFLGDRNTSPLTIFQPLSSTSSLAPAHANAGRHEVDTARIRHHEL